MRQEDTHTSSLAELNRTTVLEFYCLGLEGRRPKQAFERFMGPGFIEHKPDVADPTREGSAAFLAELMLELSAATWK